MTLGGACTGSQTRGALLRAVAGRQRQRRCAIERAALLLLGILVLMPAATGGWSCARQRNSGYEDSREAAGRSVEDVPCVAATVWEGSGAIESLALTGFGPGVLASVTVSPWATAEAEKEVGSRESAAYTYYAPTITDALTAVQLLSRGATSNSVQRLRSWDATDWYSELALCVARPSWDRGETTCAEPTPEWVNVVEPDNPCLKAVPGDVPLLFGAECSSTGEFALAFERKGVLGVVYGSLEEHTMWRQHMRFPLIRGEARDARVLRVPPRYVYAIVPGGFRNPDEKMERNTVDSRSDGVQASWLNRRRQDGVKVMLTSEGPSFYNWPRDLLGLVRGSRIYLIRDLSSQVEHSLVREGYRDVQNLPIMQVALDYWGGRYYGAILKGPGGAYEILVVSFRVTKRGRLLDSRFECRFPADSFLCGGITRMEIVGGKELLFSVANSVLTVPLPLHGTEPGH